MKEDVCGAIAPSLLLLGTYSALMRAALTRRLLGADEGPGRKECVKEESGSRRMCVEPLRPPSYP